MPPTIAPWLVDWRGRYHGARRRRCCRRPTRDEVAAVVALCAEAGVPLVPQGGNTSMVGGATPDGSGAALLLSIRRMNRIRALDRRGRHRGLRGRGDPRRPARRGAGGRPPLPADARRARARRRSAGWSRPMPAARRCCASARCARWSLGIEAVLPDGRLFEGLAALKKDNRGYDLQPVADRRRRHAGHRHRGEPAGWCPAIGERAVAWVGLDAAPDGRMALLRASRGSDGRGDRELRAGAAKRARSGARPYPRHPRRRWPRRRPGTCWSRRSSPMAAPGPEPALYEGAALGARDRACRAMR